MKCNAWTLALIGAGIVSVPAVTQAEESTNAVPALLTSLSATTLSGYVDTSMHYNPGKGNQNLPTYSPNGIPGGAKADGFNLDVIALTINKPTGEGEWGAGYNATILIGPDAVAYNNSLLGSASDLSLKDTYVALHAPVGNGLDFKLGNFTEPLGYEVYETGNNPNYTRSYGYEIEPTQLTGLIATYQINSELSAQGGIANTWSAHLNARPFQPSPAQGNPNGGTKSEGFETYIGVLTYTAPTNMSYLAGSTLSAGVISGYDQVNNVNKTSLYGGGTVNTPVTNLKAGFAIDYVMLRENSINAPAGASNKAGYQSAYALYLSYQATEKLGLYSRAEYFNQSTYLSVTQPGSPQLGQGTPYTGMPRGAFAFTETVQYDLWKNVLARLEFRWDHATATATGIVPGATEDPYSSGKDNAFLLAANIVYKF